MNSRPYKGKFPPMTSVGCRFCTFIDAEVSSDGGMTIKPAFGILYLLRDGKVVIDPFSRDGSEKPAIFPGMPDGFEIMGNGE